MWIQHSWGKRSSQSTKWGEDAIKQQIVHLNKPSVSSPASVSALHWLNSGQSLCFHVEPQLTLDLCCTHLTQLIKPNEDLLLSLNLDLWPPVVLTELYVIVRTCLLPGGAESCRSHALACFHMVLFLKDANENLPGSVAEGGGSLRRCVPRVPKALLEVKEMAETRHATGQRQREWEINGLRSQERGISLCFVGLSENVCEYGAWKNGF